VFNSAILSTRKKGDRMRGYINELPPEKAVMDASLRFLVRKLLSPVCSRLFRARIQEASNETRGLDRHLSRLSGSFLLVCISAGILPGIGLFPLSLCAQSPGSTAVSHIQPAAPPQTGASVAVPLPAKIQGKLNKLQQALKEARVTGDAEAEAKALDQLSDLYLYTSDFKKALEGYNEALALARTAKDARQESVSLNGIGDCYLSMSENSAAIETYQQALAAATASGDLHSQAAALAGLGWINNTLGKNQEALDFFNRALPLARKASDSELEARVLRRTGLVYSVLGVNKKALEYYNQALPIFHRVHDQYREATVLSDIGLVYSDLGQKQKALEYYKQALPIFREIGDRESAALTWDVMGRAYGDLGNRQMELEYYRKALPIIRWVGDLDNEAKTLNGIGNVYSILRESKKAQDYFNQALQLANASNDPIVKAWILDNMMHNQRAAEPALAIFYGKEAVNLLQQLRGNIQGLDKQLQKDFLASKDGYYRELADLLIQQGRLPEAQEVLDLLKEQEYSDYVRGDGADTMRPLPLTPAEMQAEDDYQKSTAQIVSMGEQWTQLRKIADRNPEQESQYQQISSQIEAANKGLDGSFGRLYKLFGEDNTAVKQEAVVEGNVSLLRHVLANTPRTVALYTLVGKDRVSIIVITGSVPVARKFTISEAALNKKVAAFQQALRDRSVNPKPMALELYKILIGPVKADLDQADAETLVWSLDGALRYVPMAALYDGKKYLVESYNTVTLNPDGINYLSDTPDLKKMSATAMGISLKYEDNLPSLPAVAIELGDIVKDPKALTAHGVMPGSILLDNQFTEKAMEKEMETSRSVVHIASHFVFKPGDSSKSYLLLAGKDAGGDGFHLTVADFSADEKIDLENTELLTLSACETGLSSNASNGREVDGLGMAAQQKGAKAVISSLWEVDDASTGDLMAEFYKLWAGGKFSKVAALGQAQRDLLLGRIKPESGVSGRGFDNTVSTKDLLPGYAHPYYWAPFVLMGNWK
jgi:CHAT domain-containing protein/Tfp pilus assembly protein PilF